MMKKVLMFVVILLVFPVVSLAGTYVAPNLINQTGYTIYWYLTSDTYLTIGHKKDKNSKVCSNGSATCTGNPAVILIGSSDSSKASGICSSPAIPDTSKLPGEYAAVYATITGGKNSCSVNIVVVPKWTPINPIKPTS